MDKIFQRIVSFCLLISSINSQEDYCYATEEKPYEFFGRLTSYDLVKGSDVPDSTTCKPIYIWALVKHGIKQLSDREIESSKKLVGVKKEIEINYDENLTELCPADYNGIQTWTNVLDKNESKKFVEKAIQNHESLALTLRGYLNLTTLIKDLFQFVTSKSTDAKSSAIAFSNKLLNTDYKNVLGNEIREDEQLLKLTSDCPKWSYNEQETKDFIDSSYFREMRLRIALRLGYVQELPSGITEKIQAMYESCAFDKLITSSSKPPFCAAFAPEDLKRFEYIEDLMHYYKFGYGNPFSEKFGCPLVKNMLASLSSAANDTNKLKGTFLFSDSENLAGFLTKVQLFSNTQPLTHSDYQNYKNFRDWRSSLIDPYTANIFAVLYNCENNEKTVELFHNENLIKLAGCSKSKCPLATFKSVIDKLLEGSECDDKFCTAGASSANVKICSLLVLFVGLFISQL